MAGLRCDMGAYVLVCILSILVGAALLQTIGAMSRTFEEANIYMMVILMLSMLLGTGFVREVPSWLGWARDISMMGIAADVSMYLEFKDINNWRNTLTADGIFTEYGVQITNDQQFLEGLTILFVILGGLRVLCFLFVKFLFTGRSFMENLRD